MTARSTLTLLALLVAAPALGANSTPAERRELLAIIASGARPEVNRAIERIKYLGKPRDLLTEIGRMVGSGLDPSRRNAAFALTFLATPRHTDALVGALDDEDEIVREYACKALGKLRAKGAVKPLVARARDGSPVVRREAILALGEIGAKAGVAPALALLDDPVPETRLAAIVALGKMNNAGAVPRLKGLLADGSETTRLAAARSLCQLGHADGRQVAQRLLGSEQPTERRDGIRLVEEIEAPWVTSRLLGLLEDPDQGVRIAAAVGLSRQGDGRGVQWLVLRSERADVEEKLRLETAIEGLGLTREDRRRILAAAPKAR